MNPNSDPDQRGISRRAVTTAMAWSVPVVALAAAAPLAAASTTAPSITAMDVLPAAVGDSVPLVFTVTENGVDVATGTLTVTLDDTSIVEFDPDADGYSGPTIASVEIADGVALPLVIVKAAGTVTGSATFGSTSSSFSTQVVVD